MPRVASVHIYKRGKVWYADVRHQGRRFTRSLGVQTKEAALEYRRQIEKALAEGRPPDLSARVSLAALVAAYLDACREYNVPRTANLKAAHLRAFVEAVGNIPAGHVTRADVDRHLARRRADAGGSPFVYNRELATLRHFFNVALREGVVSMNPAAGLRSLPEPRRAVVIPAEADILRFLGWCREHDALLYDLGVVAFYTGLRRGDVFELKGESYDASRRVLAVAMSKRRREKVVYIPVEEPALVAVLTRLVGRYGAGYLFPGRGAPYVNDIRRRWRRATAATGVSFGFRQFRHYFATYLLAHGADVNTVRDLLGHTNIATTARYLEVVGQLKRAAIAKLPPVSPL